ncbi:MAG: TerD family protein, partial [Desulfovibrionaceae bacterium]|nr:TerD family protein [Desulfovibrionaceae bacterium]
MALKLEKGQRINLRKDIGSNLEHFCVGCNWGAIVEKKSKFFGLITTQEIRDVDLDLSCIIVDEQGNMCDHI